MNYLQCIFVLALFTLSWLLNFCIFQRNLKLIAAVGASEEGSLHLWVNLGTPNNYTSEAYEFINVLWCEVSHEGDLIEVSDADHEFILFGHPLLMLEFFHFITNEVFFIEGFEDMVEAGNHFGRKVYELIIYLPIELLQMLPLHLENVSL